MISGKLGEEMGNSKKTENGGMRKELRGVIGAAPSMACGRVGLSKPSVIVFRARGRVIIFQAATVLHRAYASSRGIAHAGNAVGNGSAHVKIGHQRDHHAYYCWGCCRWQPDIEFVVGRLYFPSARAYYLSSKWSCHAPSYFKVHIIFAF